MTKNREKIDPCPLCGGEAEIIPWSHAEAGRHDVVVRCKSCGFEGGPTDEADIAIINWNERVNIKSPHKPCPLCMGSPQIDEDGGEIFIVCVLIAGLRSGLRLILVWVRMLGMKLRNWLGLSGIKECD